MADNAVGILFGVEGGSSITGESGSLIKKQLTEIAKQITLGVRVQIDSTNFSSQVDNLKKELDAKLGKITINLRQNGGGNSPKVNGEGGESKSEYAALKRDLATYYSLRTRLVKEGNVETQKYYALMQAMNQAHDRYTDNLKAALSLTDEQRASLERYDQELKIRSQYEEKIAQAGHADKTDTQHSENYNNSLTLLEELYKKKTQLAKVPESQGTTKAALQEQVKVREEEYAAAKKLIDVDSDELQLLNQREAALQAELVETNSLVNAQQQHKAAVPMQASWEKNIAKAKALEERYHSLIKSNDQLRAGWEKINSLITQQYQGVDHYDENGVLVNGNMADAEIQIRQLTTEMSRFSAQCSEAQSASETLGNRLKEAFSSKLVTTFSYAIIAFITRALKQVYTNIKKIDDAMTQLKIVTNASSKAYENYAKTVANSAKKIGASIADLIDSTTTYARLGYNLTEAATLAELTTVYSNISGIDVNTATTNITAIIKAYDVGANELEAVLDKLVYVGNKYAISSAELGEGMNNAASALAANGNSLEEAMGILTAANVTLQNINKSSTAVRTIAARISASTAELEELGESAGSILSTSDLDAKMRAFGVSVIDANGNLRSTYDILADLSKVWDKLNNTQQAAIADMLAGTRQQNAFYSIMQNWQDAETIVENASASYGTLQNAQSVYLDSIEGKIERLGATWEDFSTNLLESDLIKFLVDFVNGIASALNAVISFGDGAIPKFMLIIAAVAGVTAVMNKLRSVFDIVRLRLHLLNLEAGSAGGAFKLFFTTVGTAFKKFMAENAPLLIITTILTLMSTLEGKAQGFAELIVGAVTVIATGIIIAVKGIDATIKGFMAQNPIGWILLALTALVAVIKGIVDLFKSFNPSYDDLKDAAKEAKEAWEDVEDELEEVRLKIEEVQEEIERLNSLDTPTLTDQKDLERLQQELEILKQQEAAKEEQATIAQRGAMNSAEKALDKYRDEKSIKDGNGYVETTFDERMDNILKNYYHSSTSDQELVLDAIQQYNELLNGFEYGMNEKLNGYFDDYYELLDKYTIATDSAVTAWTSILARVKYQDATKILKDFADTFTDTSQITGAALKDIASNNRDVQELFNYLKDIGMWDGENWNNLTGLIGDLRTKLAELTSVTMLEDIEAITDKFESLSDALEDLGKNGALSLDSLEALLSKYPSLLSKYFNKTLDGYKISDDYKGLSNYDILKDAAITDLKEYQEVLIKAKETLAELTKEDDDYETALKNLAIAQDNLNTKEIEWASLLRETAIEDETERLEAVQDALKSQLDLYKELIDIRKDLLKTYKEEVDYQKTLAAKQKTVADLQTQLALAKLDTSASGQARVRELEAQLTEAQDELDEYTLEHAVEDITSKLDDSYNEYERFIQEQVDKIADQLNAIAQQLENILGTIEGATNTAFTGSEMYGLYTELKEKKASGMEIDSDTQAYMDAVSEGDYNAADKLYAHAKSASDGYVVPDSYYDKDKSNDELIAEKMKKVKGAYGQGISKNNSGDNGEVIYNGVTYYVESDGDDTSLMKAAYNINKYGDRDIFWYEGNIYGCLDGSIVRLRKQDGWGSFWNGSGNSNNFEALKRAIEGAGIYHTGGFVGDVSELNSNEEFAKLLKGEFVATPKQMDNFMENTLPALRGSGSSQAVFNAPLITLQTGSVTQDSLPDLEKIVKKAVKQVEAKMENALSRTSKKI